MKRNLDILVISDLHLGTYGSEADQVLAYLKTVDAKKIVINGDFVDLLAVPFVPQFDDEYWSETASLCKLNMILKAHPEVMDALSKFLGTKNKNIVYIIGNHDAELYFDSLKKRFIEYFPEEVRSNIVISNDITFNYDL